MDWERLDADYPEWKWMDPDEVRERFWMYDPLAVAFARAEVHRRRIRALFDRLSTMYLKSALRRWS